MRQLQGYMFIINNFLNYLEDYEQTGVQTGCFRAKRQSYNNKNIVRNNGKIKNYIFVYLKAAFENKEII